MTDDFRAGMLKAAEMCSKAGAHNRKQQDLSAANGEHYKENFYRNRAAALGDIALEILTACEVQDGNG